MKKPRISWKLLSEEQNVLQTVCGIEVKKEELTVWDTGKRDSSSSVLIEYEGSELSACTRFSWTVTGFNGFYFKGNSK
ncbi:MAG: hypothetical protein ACQEWW_17275 [Bacillota bacterium]